jgi:tRNA (mo5U34)-methyltransferase
MERTPASREELERRIEELGPWFHNLRIDGVPTAPEHFLGDYPAFKWAGFRHALPADLGGRSVLDIGCNAGFYSLAMKRRGAGRVVGNDSDPPYLRQAQLSVYEVPRLNEKFDLVIFMGVLYHLRHPLLALDLIHEHVAADMMLFQCMQRGSDTIPELDENYDFSEWSVFDRPDYPKLFFVEQRYAADPTNWFIPNRAAVEAMLRSAGFRIEQHPEREVYLCRRDTRPWGVEPPPC